MHVWCQKNMKNEKIGPKENENKNNKKNKKEKQEKQVRSSSTFIRPS